MSAFARLAATVCDWTMCAMMTGLQRRHRLHANSRAEIERYIAEHESASREEYFSPSAEHPTPNIQHPTSNDLAAAPRVIGCWMLKDRSILRWPSPFPSGFPENDRVHADLFLVRDDAPTVLMLHALMSASDFGYRRWAADFNARGWNAVFIHLPFHYSRKPRGYWNGELAITADSVRTAEGLRAGVAELRQLMAWLRARGCAEFALWASSYGGWIGALLASVERDFRWVALMEPIVDVEHAIWVSPAGAALRRELRAGGIEHALIERHFRLVSPMHGEPLCGGERVIFCAGEYDRIALAADIARLHAQWCGSELLRVPQGHFGYRMMRATWARLVERGLI